jgi:hypothetical protein
VFDLRSPAQSASNSSVPLGLCGLLAFFDVSTVAKEKTSRCDNLD